MMPVAEPACDLVAPSFNGRTAASGAAYRGSNPWGAANNTLPRTFLNLPTNVAGSANDEGMSYATPQNSTERFRSPQH
jgi:hypothetical protein